MRYQDATNLFAGLSRYSLKPEKSPLENFCTELLAWCLQNSGGFQKKFLKLMGLDFLENFKGRLEIETQQYWIKNDDDDEQEESGVAEPEVRQRGFFDLIIQTPPNSNGKRDFLIALESKIGADFERGQLPDYRAELARIKKVADYTHCCLVTLTKLSKKPPRADAHIRWPQVQDLLSKIRVEDSKLEMIYRQFADFLKEKGIAPMKIDKVNPELLKWGRCFNLQIDLWRILDRLRAGEELKSLMKHRIVFEPAKNVSKLSLGI